MMKNSRILWVDIAKGIGILLVLIGHISQNQYISSFIYGFHMPLFFIISGYLYKNKENYIKNKIKTILIPYLFFSIISFIYWYFIERNLRGQNENINIFNILINIFIARGGNDNYIFNVALWFLPCLLVTEIIFHIIVGKIKNNRIVTIIVFIFSILGYIYAQYDLIRLPLALDMVFIAIGFYFIGYLWRQKGEFYFKNKMKISKNKEIIIIIIGSLFMIMFSIFNIRIDINNLKYPVYPLIYIVSITGCIVIYLISNLIKNNNFIQYLGTNTLIIMCIHEPIKRIVIELLHIITGTSTEILRTNFIYIIIITIILIIVIIPAIFIINKYLPFLIGRKKGEKNANN